MRVIRLLSFLILLCACEKKEEQKTSTFPVKVGRVIQQNIPYFVTGVGQLIPSVTVDIKAQVSGILTSVLFEDGQFVEEGDLLITIDPRIYEAELEEAKAQLVEDEARLAYALDFAKTYGLLVGEEYVARLQYEEGVQNVGIYKGAVEYDLAAIKKAAVTLGYTQIRSPFSGYLGLRTYDPGNYVDITIDKSLVTLNKATPLKVSFSLSSQYLQEIREYQNINPLYLEAVLPSDPSHPLTGSLYFIDNTVNEETGMIHLEGIVPNNEQKGWPGQFVRVYLRLKQLKEAVLIPQSAVMLGQTGNFVFVVDEKNDTVSMRMIGKGIHYQNYFVAEWGLKEDETVITDGQLNLYDGAKIKESK